RDAADVEAGAAQSLAALGASGFETELRSADRGDVTAGTAPDNQDVEIVTVKSHSKTPLALSLSKGCLFVRLQEKDRASTGSARTGSGYPYKSIKSRVGSSIASLTRTRKVTASRPSTSR